MGDVVIVEGYESLMDSLNAVQDRVMKLELCASACTSLKSKLFDILHDLQTIKEYLVEQK